MEANQFNIKTGWPENYQLMAACLDQWWEYDSMNAGLLKEKLEGDPFANPDLCLTAWHKGDPVGFLFAVRRDIRGQAFGYVKLMGVHPGFRRKKIATNLYQLAEKRLAENGAKVIRIYDVPLNYFMPGIDPRYTPALCFAWEMGFQQFGEAVNMVCELEPLNLSTEVEEKKLEKLGVTVRRALPEDKPLLTDLLSGEWELWKHEVEMAYQDNPPSLHVAFIDGKLRAFSAHNGNNKGTGWFGPMGTHPDMRGKGVGSILLKRCLDDMRRQGYKSVVIPWVAPIAFYSHYVNARIDRVFWRMEKHLKPIVN